MEREENNLFKYATKELSQDAFICWAINWINYPENKLYELGKDMLNAVLFPDVEDKKLYPNYNRAEIIDKYNFSELNINKTIAEDKAEYEKEIEEINAIYENKNKEIEIIRKNIIKSIKNLKADIEIDKITNLKVIRQFKRMDIVITINKKYIIIIEDKIDGTTNEQLERYTKVMKETIENDDDSLELLEINRDEFNTDSIIPVYMKTGNLITEEKMIEFRRINSNVIVKILENYINESDIIADFYNNLKGKLEKENLNKYLDITEKGFIEEGEQFAKKYVILNCFKNYLKNEYASNKNLAQKGYFKITNLVYVWTPRLFNYNGWKNTIIDNGDIIIEERLQAIDNDTMTEKEIRYVFARERDIFGDEFFEFKGVYSLDLQESTQNKRIWRKINKNKIVTLNIGENLEKELNKN